MRQIYALWICIFVLTLLPPGCGQDEADSRKDDNANTSESSTDKQEFVAAPEPPRTKGETYSHVLGFSFWHPDDWTVQAAEEFLYLVPDDMHSNADGATEAYLLLGENVAGENITRPDDQRVVQYLQEQLFFQLVPYGPRRKGKRSDWLAAVDG